MVGVVMCIYTFIVFNTPLYVSYQTSLIYLFDSWFMTIMIAVNWSSRAFVQGKDQGLMLTDTEYYFMSIMNCCKGVYFWTQARSQSTNRTAVFARSLLASSQHILTHCTMLVSPFPDTQNKPWTLDPWVVLLILEIATSTTRLAGQCDRGTSPHHSAASLQRTSNVILSDIAEAFKQDREHLRGYFVAF
jgi:hypothetical protein